MLLDALLAAKRACPNRIAVADATTQLTYARLVRLARVFRRVIQQTTSRERVGIMLPASAGFPAALFGSLWAKRIPVPLNFLLHRDELAFIVEDAELDVVLSVGPLVERVGDLPVPCLQVEQLPLRRRLLGTYFSPAPRVPAVDPHAPAVMLYTSGTTATPKGVVLSQRNLHSNAADSIASLAMVKGQPFLNLLPPFHVFGLTGNVIVPIMLQSPVFALPRFSPVRAVQLIEQHEIVVLMAVPSMLGAMLRVKSATRETFRSLKLLISGGEPLSAGVRDGWRDRFGIEPVEGYGLTETSPIISVAGPWDAKPGTVGRPIRNAEVRIVDEQGGDQPVGSDGEIIVRSPGVMQGYHGRPAETAAVLDDAGWFHTGDIGRFDADGFLSITGRIKDLLIIGGENVFPGEIEAALAAHPDVAEAAVIGTPDASRGEAPVAFVILREGASVSADQLQQFARQSLAGYKVPKYIHVREDLPRGPTGKILKRTLRQEAGEEATGSRQ